MRSTQGYDKINLYWNNLQVYLDQVTKLHEVEKENVDILKRNVLDNLRPARSVSIKF